MSPCLNYDYILAINVNPILKFKNTFLGNLYRAGYVLLNSNIKYSKQKASKYIEIKECGNFSIFDLKNFDKIYEAGYKQAQKEIELLKKDF